MSRKILGIVSSYNELCGNATYTHVLKQEFERHYEVRIIAVNHKLLAMEHDAVRGAQEEHLAGLCTALRACDLVNIQYEPGLYGASPSAIVRNISRMIDVSNRLVFTVHRTYGPPDQGLKRTLMRSVAGGPRKLIGALRDWRYRRSSYRMTARVIDALRAKEKTRPGTVTAIVHTKRDAEILRLHHGFKQVVDFPITFLNRAQIDSHVEARARIRAEVMAQYGLNPAHKHIGIFGFLSENKGHHVAVEALKYLPDDYRLSIFGGQHPMSLREYDLNAMLQDTAKFSANSSPYISSLIELTKELLTPDTGIKLSPEGVLQLEENAHATSEPGLHRARFLGSVGDADFLRAIVAMDYIVVPYFETGQGGSGNASLALELQAKAIFSRNVAFLELSRYFPGCYRFADVGNALEIAQSIFFWNEDFTDAQRHANATYNIANNIRLHMAAFEGGAEGAQAFRAALTQPQAAGIASAA